MSVQCLQSVTLLTPTGEELSAGAAGVEYHQFEALRMFVVPKPAPGTWKAIAAGRGFFAIRVEARTPLRLGGVEWPSNASLEATVNGPARQAAFSFVAANGAPIGAVQLGLEDESADRRMYRGPAIKPPRTFVWPFPAWIPEDFRSSAWSAGCRSARRFGGSGPAPADSSAPRLLRWIWCDHG